MRVLFESSTFPITWFSNEDSIDSQKLALNNLRKSALTSFTFSQEKFAELSANSVASSALSEFVRQFYFNCPKAELSTLSPDFRIVEDTRTSLSGILNSEKFDQVQKKRNPASGIHSSREVWFESVVLPVLQFSHKIQIIDGYILNNLGSVDKYHSSGWLLEKILAHSNVAIEVSCAEPKAQNSNFSDRDIANKAEERVRSFFCDLENSNSKVSFRAYRHKSRSQESKDVKFPHDRFVRFLFQTKGGDASSLSMVIGKGTAAFDEDDGYDIRTTAEVSKEVWLQAERQLSLLTKGNVGNFELREGNQSA
jgi:hypothetical protein